ncbi:PE family protein [Mycobacterium kansasii 662]|uniref:PE family protein n=1 Tax=Mycobacterium kansasii 662 TaxID=1299326 RepID=X7ZQP1_MYCKA|nr:PE family protein [Mycobacterium kansasii]EUA21524.1 PE family protein [Mycobacterium kansasii 662]
MSSYVIAAPDAIATASGNLTGIEEAIRKAAAAASSSTTRIAVAAADEVSTAIATLFGGYAQEFQTLVARTTLFHNEFSRALSAAGAAYAAAEAANAAPLGRCWRKSEVYFHPLNGCWGLRSSVAPVAQRWERCSTRPPMRWVWAQC